MSKKKGKNNEESSNENLEDIQYEIEETEYEDVSQKDKIKKLRKELSDEKKQSHEYLTGWQKERASFANYKVNEEKIRKSRIDMIKLDFISDLFPVLDSFDMAFSNKESWEKVDSAWRTGVEYIHTQFMNILEKYNVKPINEINTMFDPNIHEQSDILLTKDKNKVDKIASIIQTGYIFGKNTIRPAKVRVYKFEKTEKE